MNIMYVYVSRDVRGDAIRVFHEEPLYEELGGYFYAPSGNLLPPAVARFVLHTYRDKLEPGQCLKVGVSMYLYDEEPVTKFNTFSVSVG